MLSVRDPIRRRPPVERPLDIVALELLVSVTQALLAGILLSLAAQLGGDARAQGLPIPGLLAVLGIAVGVGWLRWLMGSGWVMAAVSGSVAILAGALWLLALQDPTLPRIDPLVGLIGFLCAVYGLVAGVFLDGPHHSHWKGGISAPHRGVPPTRATPARFSPPVQKVVDERLSDIHLPKVALPSAPRIALPAVRRGGSSTDTDTGGSLTPAEPVPPQPPRTTTGSEPVAVTSAAASSSASTTAPAEEATPTAAAKPAAAKPAKASRSVAATRPAAAPEPVADPRPTPTPDTRPASSPDLEATEVVPATPAARATGTATVDATRSAPAGSTDPTDAVTPTEAATRPATDPDAPTQPEARAAVQWPRPIEPRGHTGAHRTDPQA